MSLSTHHFQLGLIGYPLSHSLSPKIQAAAIQSCGIQGDYSLFPISPDDNQALKDLLARVRSGEMHGLNVTIPHKQNVILFLDELMPTAKSIGAVNTIYLKNNKLIGDNTDAPGFLIDLKRALKFSREAFHLPFSALILGAGGSARAVVYALLSEGWNVTIAARRMEQAQQLAASFTNYQLRITAMEINPSNLHAERLISNISLIINTTPVGMTPNTNQSPWPENLPFPPHVAIYDLVYNPRETKLMHDAHRQGLQATTGLGMLIEQAALSLEIWTGQSPSREIMRTSIEQSPTLAPGASAGVTNL
jgi:shikimate dehydrogenase